MNRKFPVLFFLGSVGILIQYFLIPKNTNLTQELLTNIVTFLSVLFGFYITSLAIFVTSRYVADLYQIEDKLDTSQTLLDRLLKEYRFGLTLALFSLLYFIFLSLLFIKEASFSDVKNLPVIPLILMNVVYSYLMLGNLIKIIIKEAKTRKN